MTGSKRRMSTRLEIGFHRKRLWFDFPALTDLVTIPPYFCVLRLFGVVLNFIMAINQNQIFQYTPCNTPKRVTSLRGPSPRHCARAAQLLSKKCHSGGESLATLCLI